MKQEIIQLAVQPKSSLAQEKTLNHCSLSFLLSMPNQTMKLSCCDAQHAAMISSLSSKWYLYATWSYGGRERVDFWNALWCHTGVFVIVLASPPDHRSPRSPQILSRVHLRTEMETWGRVRVEPVNPWSWTTCFELEGFSDLKHLETIQWGTDAQHGNNLSERRKNPAFSTWGMMWLIGCLFPLEPGKKSNQD